MELIEVKGGRGLDDFIGFPRLIYRKYPLYVPQLNRELKTQFSPKNPFFGHAEVKLFILLSDGSPVGRIASIVNRGHNEYHGDETGFFGFFESLNDPAVAARLLDAASGELRRRGLKTMRGPMNFSTNEECGFLLEGFGEPPVLMTPYNPPYYNALMDGAGLMKAKDLYAYVYDVAEALPQKVLTVARYAERKKIRVRAIDKRTFNSEMRVFMDVYNSAWKENWGFIPLTEEELDFISERLKQIVVPELTLIAEKDGEPVGFLGLVPDFNFVLKKMNGKLNPLSIAKALYYSRKIKDLRLMLFGIKDTHRAMGVDALLMREGFGGIKKGGYRRVEFSWILEDNTPMKRIIEMIGGRLYKKYRIYERGI